MHIEEYIKNKRDAFDSHRPDKEKIWKGIQTKRKSQKQSGSFLWKAAAVFFLITSLALAFGLWQHQQKNEYLLAHISPALLKQEKSYIHNISIKYLEAESFAQKSSINFAPYQKELDEIDLEYKDYISDLGQNCCNEELVQILMDYYEKKIRLLNRILFEIQKQNEYEKQEQAIEA